MNDPHPSAARLLEDPAVRNNLADLRHQSIHRGEPTAMLSGTIILGIGIFQKEFPGQLRFHQIPTAENAPQAFLRKLMTILELAKTYLVTEFPSNLPGNAD
jgi:hypothetical protein